MKTVCAAEMPFAAEAFGTLGEVDVREGRHIAADDVRDADLLAVRSTTRVGRALLEGSRVRFAGTATIGYDHFDVAYLERSGIAWCCSPGCNANSVSEYVVAALLCLGRRHGLRLEGRTIGVVGVGNVGTRVVAKARALGLRVLQNDPPRRDATGDPAFLPLDAVLPESDIVTMHVPLTREGRHPTRHLVNREFLARVKPGAIFLNAARGAVVDTDALLAALAQGRVAHAVMDTWEGEPAYRADLLQRSDLGTPHIAGYSFEGKVNGTLMVYEAACRFLGRPADWSPDGRWPEPAVPSVSVDAAGRTDEDVLAEVVRRVYDIEADDARLRAGCHPEDPARGREFDRLRNDYPMRREFAGTAVELRRGGESLRRKLAGLGFAAGASR
jgi:erythronate-4-phosphate dehydrogenase